MRISELIIELTRRQNLHGDLEVQITWEGTTREIELENVYRSGLGYPWNDDPVLLLDADRNTYKSIFQHPGDRVNDPTDAAS